MTPRLRRPLLSTLTAAALLVAPAALADWAGEVRLRTATPSSGQPPEQKGKVYGRKTVLRLDLEPAPQQQASGTTSFIIDLQRRMAVTLMHKQKLATHKDVSELPLKLPALCPGKGQDFDACFLSRGFKKTGSARVNGQLATVYEASVPGEDGRPRRQKLWRPTELPEVPYVRAQTFEPGGLVESELDVLDIKVGPQPDSRFTVPADYQQRGGFMPEARQKGLKPEDLQGKTPDEIEKLIKERMGSGAPRRR